MTIMPVPLVSTQTTTDDIEVQPLEESPVRQTAQGRGIAVIMTLVLMMASSPVQTLAQSGEEEGEIPADTIRTVRLTAGLTDFRGQPVAASLAQERRIIQLDAFVEPARSISVNPLELPRSSRWKWIAIGAGAAGAAVVAYLAGRRGASLTIPSPMGDITVAALPAPSPILAIPSIELVPPAATTPVDSGGTPADEGGSTAAPSTSQPDPEPPRERRSGPRRDGGGGDDDDDDDD